MTIPTVNDNALGYGAFLGLYANLRYQLLCGFDMAMVYHFDVIGVALCFSTTLRSSVICVSVSTQIIIRINLHLLLFNKFLFSCQVLISDCCYVFHPGL